jgi:hypothetical protein
MDYEATDRHATILAKFQLGAVSYWADESRGRPVPVALVGNSWRTIDNQGIALNPRIFDTQEDAAEYLRLLGKFTDHYERANDEPKA